MHLSLKKIKEVFIVPSSTYCTKCVRFVPDFVVSPRLSVCIYIHVLSKKHVSTSLYCFGRVFLLARCFHFTNIWYSRLPFVKIIINIKSTFFVFPDKIPQNVKFQSERIKQAELYFTIGGEISIYKLYSPR